MLRTRSPKPLTLFYRVLSLLSLVLMAGVVGRVPLAQVAPQPLRPSFSISIRTPHHDVKAGSPILVLITITNTSGHEIYLSASKAPSQGEFNHQLVVLDEKGRVPPLTQYQYLLRGEVPPSQSGAPPIVIPYSELFIPISPGHTGLDEILINKLYDMSHPGRYSIQILRTDPESKTIVKSNTIQINVRAPSTTTGTIRVGHQFESSARATYP